MSSILKTFLLGQRSLHQVSMVNLLSAGNGDEGVTASKARISASP